MTPPDLPQRRTHLLFVAVVILVLLSLTLRGAPVSVATARQELIKWEGYKLTPYKDGATGISVGIGHSLSANREQVKPRYTRAEVEALFRRDYAWCVDVCRRGIEGFDDLPERAQLVALSVAFTTGREGFMRFTAFRLALSWRAYNAAAHELHLSKWATQVSKRRAEHHVGVLLSL